MQRPRENKGNKIKIMKLVQHQMLNNTTPLIKHFKNQFHLRNKITKKPETFWAGPVHSGTKHTRSKSLPPTN